MTFNKGSQKVIIVAFIMLLFAVFTTTIYKNRSEIKKILPDTELSIIDKTKKIETIFTDNMFQKNIAIGIFGASMRLLGRDYVEDIEPHYSVVRLADNYISFIGKKGYDENYAKQIIKLNDELTQSNTDFLFLQTPHKLPRNIDILPNGESNYPNIVADSFIMDISAAGVPYLDLRDNIDAEGADHNKMFFNTDHHWTPQTGLWASELIAEYLNNSFDFEIDTKVLDIENYEVNTYEKWFLGSVGRRVGPIYAGVDDISVLTPKFETDLQYNVPIEGIDKRGSFEDTLIDYSKIDTKNYYDISPYVVYTGGDFPLSVIKNYNTDNTKKVLLLRDSFACVLTPFLGLGVGELHSVDPRYFTDVSISDYIASNDFDLVIFETNPGYSEDQFNFWKQETK